MGCGGSKTFAEDGSILEGKGESKIELAAGEYYAAMAIWGGDEDALVEVKKVVPNPKELFLNPWDQRSAYAGKTHWLDVEPATYNFRFNVNHKRCAFPGADTLDLCQKVYEVHAKTPENIPKAVVLAAKQTKGDHPYKAENGMEVAKADMDELKNLVSTHQMSDNLGPIKALLVMLEDNVPYGSATLACNVAMAPGKWEENEAGEVARVLGLADQVRLKAESLQGNPSMIRQIRYKVDETVRKALKGSLKPGLAKFGLDLEKLVPNLDDLLDVSAGRRPGATMLGTAKPPPAVKDETPDQAKAREDARLENEKYLWEKDKPLLDQWVQDDKDPKKCRDQVEVVASAQAKDIMSNMDKKLTARDLEEGTIVLARFNKTKFFHEGKILRKNSDTDYQVEFPETPDEMPYTERISPLDDKGEANMMSMPPCATKDNLTVGTKVTVRRSGDMPYFYKAVVCAVNRDGTYDVRDAVSDVERNKQLSDLWMANTLPDVCGRLHIEDRKFINVSFRLVLAMPNVAAKLRIWREVDKEGSLQEIDGVVLEGPLKPTKKVPEPVGNTFLGWTFKVSMLPNRAYCYQYVLGDQVYLDWNLPAKNDKSYKRLTVSVSL
eukprot:PhM_4_TR11422/c1_g1_i2/m.75905